MAKANPPGPLRELPRATAYTERDTGKENWVHLPEQADGQLQDQIVQVAVADPELKVGDLRSQSARDLIEAGESGRVEFKASARWSYQRGDKDKAVEEAVVKSVAAFMNARGGTLLIGVDDRGRPIGLASDLKTLQRADRDGYENWLTTLFEHTIGKPPIASMAISFEEIEGHEICRIDVEPAASPVFVKVRDDAWFYVRLNNSTRRLSGEEVLDYVGRRWTHR